MATSQRRGKGLGRERFVARSVASVIDAPIGKAGPGWEPKFQGSPCFPGLAEEAGSGAVLPVDEIELGHCGHHDSTDPFRARAGSEVDIVEGFEADGLWEGPEDGDEEHDNHYHAQGEEHAVEKMQLWREGIDEKAVTDRSDQETHQAGHGRRPTHGDSHHEHSNNGGGDIAPTALEVFEDTVKPGEERSCEAARHHKCRGGDSADPDQFCFGGPGADNPPVKVHGEDGGGGIED